MLLLPVRVMSRRRVTIQVGDRVCYRVAFLRSIGCTIGEMPRARGTVTAMRPFGGEGNHLCSITWESGDWPARVLCQNLAKVGSLAATGEDR